MYPEIFVSVNFFMRIQKYLRPHLAYTNLIWPSTHIRFVSGHLKGLVNRAHVEKDWFWYCDISVYKNILIPASTRIRIHSVYRNFHSEERIQKSPDVYPHKKNLRIQKSLDTCGRGLKLLGMFTVTAITHCSCLFQSFLHTRIWSWSVDVSQKERVEKRWFAQTTFS